jgi:uncharacterized DUF497 family protein
MQFEWDDANEDHIAEHGVAAEEVEEAFADPRRRDSRAYNTATERRGAVLGRTADGRLLFVVYTLRRGRVRVVTARDATAAERQWYRRR